MPEFRYVPAGLESKGLGRATPNKASRLSLQLSSLRRMQDWQDARMSALLLKTEEVGIYVRILGEML